MEKKTPWWMIIITGALTLVGVAAGAASGGWLAALGLGLIGLLGGAVGGTLAQNKADSVEQPTGGTGGQGDAKGAGGINPDLGAGVTTGQGAVPSGVVSGQGTGAQAGQNGGNDRGATASTGSNSGAGAAPSYNSSQNSLSTTQSAAFEQGHANPAFIAGAGVAAVALARPTDALLRRHTNLKLVPMAMQRDHVKAEGLLREFKDAKSITTFKQADHLIKVLDPENLGSKNPGHNPAIKAAMLKQDRPLTKRLEAALKEFTNAHPERYGSDVERESVRLREKTKAAIAKYNEAYAEAERKGKIVDRKSQTPQEEEYWISADEYKLYNKISSDSRYKEEGWNKLDKDVRDRVEEAISNYKRMHPGAKALAKDYINAKKENVNAKLKSIGKRFNGGAVEKAEGAIAKYDELKGRLDNGEVLPPEEVDELKKPLSSRGVKNEIEYLGEHATRPDLVADINKMVQDHGSPNKTAVTRVKEYVKGRVEKVQDKWDSTGKSINDNWVEKADVAKAKYEEIKDRIANGETPSAEDVRDLKKASASHWVQNEIVRSAKGTNTPDLLTDMNNLVKQYEAPKTNPVKQVINFFSRKPAVGAAANAAGAQASQSTSQAANPTSGNGATHATAPSVPENASAGVSPGSAASSSASPASGTQTTPASNPVPAPGAGSNATGHHSRPDHYHMDKIPSGDPDNPLKLQGRFNGGFGADPLMSGHYPDNYISHGGEGHTRAAMPGMSSPASVSNPVSMPGGSPASPAPAQPVAANPAPQASAPTASTPSVDVSAPTNVVPIETASAETAAASAGKMGKIGGGALVALPIVLEAGSGFMEATAKGESAPRVAGATAWGVGKGAIDTFAPGMRGGYKDIVGDGLTPVDRVLNIINDGSGTVTAVGATVTAAQAATIIDVPGALGTGVVTAVAGTVNVVANVAKAGLKVTHLSGKDQDGGWVYTGVANIAQEPGLAWDAHKEYAKFDSAFDVDIKGHDNYKKAVAELLSDKVTKHNGMTKAEELAAAGVTLENGRVTTRAIDHALASSDPQLREKVAHTLQSILQREVGAAQAMQQENGTWVPVVFQFTEAQSQRREKYQQAQLDEKLFNSALTELPSYNQRVVKEGEAARAHIVSAEQLAQRQVIAQVPVLSQSNAALPNKQHNAGTIVG